MSSDDISPLPSPLVSLSRRERESQHTASLEPSPISPLATCQIDEASRQDCADLLLDPDMSPVLMTTRERKRSRSIQDPVADMSLPGMSTPSHGIRSGSRIYVSARGNKCAGNGGKEKDHYFLNQRQCSVRNFRSSEPSKSVNLNEINCLVHFHYTYK